MQEQASTTEKAEEIVEDTTSAVGSTKVIDAANCCLATIDCCLTELAAAKDTFPSWHPDAAFDPAGPRPIEVSTGLIEKWFQDHGQDPWDGNYTAFSHFQTRAVETNNDRQERWHQARGLTYNKLHVCCGMIHRADHDG